MDVPSPKLPIQPTAPRSGRRVEYVPPSTEVIRQYSHAVCRQLSQSTVSTVGFTEVFQGFIAFVDVVVRIQAKKMNRKESHV